METHHKNPGYVPDKLLFSQIPESATDSYSCSGNHFKKFLELPPIVDVDVRLNQAVTQQFSRTSSGVTLNFQKPG